MPKSTKPATLGQLRESGYRVLPVKEEMRQNLMRKMRAGEEIFPGIVGYEETVIPQIENAILSGQDIILLGERGQAKTRIARSLVNLLDEETPAIAGCEINDDPLRRICKACKTRIAEEGDETPIHWIPRDQRYGEKLATPDITIADLIGEVDPIKVAEGRYLSDELTIHYGLVPRTNRGIFCINELPDLAERIQVGLLNIMEERDVQIRGYKIRLPLDVFVVASANPEDYTNRGRIITPLKDRLGSEIRTHYPRTIEHEIAIMESEATPFEAEGIEVGLSRLHEADRRRDHAPGAPQQRHQPAVRRQRARLDHQLREHAEQRRAPRHPAQGAPGGAAHQRPERGHRLDGGQDRAGYRRRGPRGEGGREAGAPGHQHASSASTSR